jgi:hypothetical protein
MLVYLCFAKETKANGILEIASFFTPQKEIDREKFFF